MTAFKALAPVPITEVPATRVFRDPTQENRVSTSSSVVAPQTPVFEDASGSLQSGNTAEPVVRPLSSVEQLRLLADYWAAWRRLPDVSQWVLNTVRHGTDETHIVCGGAGPARKGDNSSLRNLKQNIKLV
ncbi:hypothetical protein Q8A67_010195 [Cirrhinus molitorella]|uniref:Uncharacterized protein n=1 Tax=Cirrhinus molitorella TaxID=172907 RepID=A0AA88PW48_9TELE|nr:hypothetical protein Q8A67_010195 [Cirrhinus molitorella]